MMMAGKAFWYKLLDIIHYARLNLTNPQRGFIVLTKQDWAQCFYRTPPSGKSDRAWERWKGEARKEGLLCALPGDEDERPSYINNRIVIRVVEALDAFYMAVGAPHPLGLAAQVRCERERRQELLPLVVRGIAAAAQVEQRRLLRLVG